MKGGKRAGCAKDKMRISNETANNRCTFFEDKNEVDKDEDKSSSDVNREEENNDRQENQKQFKREKGK